MIWFGNIMPISYISVVELNDATRPDSNPAVNAQWVFLKFYVETCDMTMHIL
jgi:hypothetical protein